MGSHRFSLRKLAYSLPAVLICLSIMRCQTRTSAQQSSQESPKPRQQEPVALPRVTPAQLAPPIPEMPEVGSQIRVVGHAEVDGRPVLRLENGRFVMLSRRQDLEVPPWFKFGRNLPVPVPMCSSPPFPPAVNLQANQTPVRDQGGRDTCTVFAMTAGVEAAYRRVYGLTLDLSEQYLQHVQKAFWLNSSALTPLTEIQPDTNGGGNVRWQAAVLQRYALPEEATLPYIGAGDYQNTDQPGDVPSGLDSPTETQKALDDFELSSTLTTFAIPEPLTTTIFPQAAFEDARFQPTQVNFADGASLASLDWYKSQLACSHEVVFQVNLNSWPPGSGVWQPGTGADIGSHAMLIVGYDDSRDAFLVKNSWGGTALLWFGYDWVRQSRITDAGIIVDVVPPRATLSTWNNPALFLGRWNMDHDGWHGILDIYRLPGPNNDPTTDRRVGTYFGPDGIARRVNAMIIGNSVQFTIDWNNPNQAWNVMQGMRFTGFLFSWDHLMLAGTMLDNRDANTYGFHAQKSTPWIGVPATGLLDLNAYGGIWRIEHDGWTGQLMIPSVDAATRSFSGIYTGSDGRSFQAQGTVESDPRKFSMTINFPGAPQPFTGFLYGHELQFAAGTTTWNSIPFGFAMVRTGDAPHIRTKKLF